MKFLSTGGAVTTFILAFLIFGIGGIIWSVPIIVFFFTSRILFKANPNRLKNSPSYNEKDSARNHWQVLANGGLSGIFSIFYFYTHNDFFYFGYLAALSVVCSDTWSSEIGTWVKSDTYNILNLNLVEQGFSGGISVLGSLGGIAGSIIIALSGFLLIEFNIKYFVIIIVSGIFGNVVDSLFGASIQVKRRCVICCIIVEEETHCRQGTLYSKGLSFINNNVVNFLASLSGVLFFLLLLKIT